MPLLSVEVAACKCAQSAPNLNKNTEGSVCGTSGGHEMDASLGVTGVDKIWPEENTRHEDSSEERTSPCHKRHTPAGSAKSPQVHRQNQRSTLARRPEETPVCTRGAQRAGPNCRKNTAGPCAPIHPVDRQPGLGTHLGRRHRPRTLLMTNCFFFGRANELGGRTIC